MIASACAPSRAGPARRAGSPLDLLHPDGAAARVAVVGCACPSLLLPTDSAAGEGSPQVDALILAPDPRECRTSGWLEEAAATTDRRLASNGLAYVIVPRRWRSRARRLLEERGLVAGATYLHVRQGANTTYLVPCDTAIARRLLRTVSAPRASVVISDLFWSMPGASRVARRGWPVVGVVVQRPGARRPAGWMRGDPRSEVPQSTLIRWRSRAGSVSAVVAISSAATGEPDAVLKVPLTDTAAAACTREAAMMSRLRGAASEAGAVIAPATVRFQNGRPMLRLGVVHGTPATHALRANPRRLVQTLEDLGGWLARWHLLTRQSAVADPGRLQREVMLPATALAVHLADGAGYLAWLDRRCAQIAGLPLPVVASHNDLTMSNLLLLTGRPAFAILDWEAAREDGLPLTDFFYAAASARGAARGGRGGSLIESFDGTTRAGRDVDRIASQISHALGLRADVVVMLKHACALQHAVNEQRDPARQSRPFLALVQWLAAARGARS